MLDENFKILRGDVFYAENSNATKREQSRLRPYVVVSNNLCNKHSPVITVVPLTTAEKKKELPTHYVFCINGKTNCALCEQVTCLNKDDIKDYYTTINGYDLAEIENRIKIQLNMGEQ